MKNKNLLTKILILSLVLSSCKNTSSNLTTWQNCLISIDDLGGKLLGKELDSVNGFSNCFQVSDTLFEADVTWRGKKITKNRSVLFTVETSWKDSILISRITIESPLVKTLSNISVGSKLGDIISNMSSDIPVMPDGYFALKDAKNTNIVYHFDVSKYSDVGEGRVNNISELPKEMKVLYVILQEH